MDLRDSSTFAVVFLMFFFWRNVAVNASRGGVGPELITWSQSHHEPFVEVDLNGKGNFTSVQAAIDKVRTDNINRFKIYIHPGIYRYAHVVTTPSIIIFYGFVCRILHEYSISLLCSAFTLAGDNHGMQFMV